jgi:C-type lysozyme/alpha-lactalbumin family
VLNHFAFEFAGEIQSLKLQVISVALLLIDKMISLLWFFLLLVNLSTPKQYEICELSIELFQHHNVAREDLFKHLCVTRKTSSKTNHRFVEKDVSYHGIYEIGGPWWCMRSRKGGKCNIFCYQLEDEKIADDVQCAKQILSSHGLNGWNKNYSHCFNNYQKVVDACLERAKLTILTAPTSNNPSGLMVDSFTLHSSAIEHQLKVKEKNLIVSIVMISIVLLIALIVCFIDKFVNYY